MKREVAAMLVAVGLAQAAVLGADGPKLKFDKTEYDFGVTSQVQSVSGMLPFVNAGDTELKVRAVGSCGCTGVTVKPDTVKPGEKGEVTFTINVTGVRGRTQKFITVTTDPPTTNVRLTAQMDVRQVFDMNPAQVQFHDVRQGAATNAVVELRRTDGKPLVVTKVQNSSPLLKVHTETRLVVEMTGTGDPQQFSDSVQVFTDDSTTPTMVIPVFGRLVGDVVVDPDLLDWRIGYMPRLPATQSQVFLTRSVRVSATREDQTLQLRNPTSTLKDLALEIVTDKTGQIYRVVARLPEAPKESQQGTITIETNLASQPTVVVPIRINVATR